MLAAFVATIMMTGAAPTPPPPAAQSAPTGAARPVISAEHLRVIQPQIYPHWLLACDDPGFVRLRVVLEVVVDRRGRLMGEPTPVRPEATAAYADALERAREAVVGAAPFRTPRDFAGGQFRLVFNPARACANR
jgi:hypothetical protein